MLLRASKEVPSPSLPTAVLCTRAREVPLPPGGWAWVLSVQTVIDSLEGQTAPGDVTVGPESSGSFGNVKPSCLPSPCPVSVLPPNVPTPMEVWGDRRPG